MSERFFASCPRGLEAPLAAELATIGAIDIAPTAASRLPAIASPITRTSKRGSPVACCGASAAVHTATRPL
jgi:hypothetical protein